LISHGVNEKVVGVMLAGVNPRHELDDTYRSALNLHSRVLTHTTLTLTNFFTNRIFFNLFANNASSIIMNATAREEERQRAEVCSARTPLAGDCTEFGGMMY
jgi:hypothetical protein